MEIDFEIVVSAKELNGKTSTFKVGDIVRVICKKDTYVGRLRTVHEVRKSIILDVSKEYYSEKVDIPIENIRYMRLENIKKETI